MALLCDQYINVAMNDRGKIQKIDYNIPDNFNFAYDVVDVLAREKPQKTALMWCNKAGEERRFTFAEIAKYTNRAANLFCSRGVKKGDKVLVILKRHYEFWYTILALHKIGAVGVPATNLLTTYDIDYRLKAAGISHIVCTAEGKVSDCVDESLEKYPGLKNKFLAKGEKTGWIGLSAEVEKQSDVFERPSGGENPQNDDMMLLYFTSGTTGYPKMVWHDFTYPLAHIVTAKYWHNVVSEDHGLHLTVAESGWMKFMWGKLYGQWMCEAGIFAYDFDKFEPDDMLHMLEKYKITTFCAPPTIYRFLITQDVKKYDLSSLGYVTTAGEALNPEVFNRFKELTGLSIKDGFGQSETTLLTFNKSTTPPRPGSMGRASPAYDVDIVDEYGRSCPPGVNGEIVVRLGDKKVPGLFCGYYNDPDKTEESHRGGFYHTGDMVWRDEDGYIWYVGRNDDLIKSSGYRIGPFEIESVIMEHEAVLECAVTGVPDPVRGQAVKATIVLNKGFSPTDNLKESIQKYVKTHTAPYKYPRVVEFVTELPKTISGKIRRAEIRGDM